MAIAVGRDMLRGSYRWNVVEGEGGKRRQLDLSRFSRREGHEVLAMVQVLANHFGYAYEEEVRVAEDAIRTALPGRLRSRRKVLTWLIEHLDPRRAERTST